MLSIIASTRLSPRRVGVDGGLMAVRRGSMPIGWFLLGLGLAVVLAAAGAAIVLLVTRDDGGDPGGAASGSPPPPQGVDVGRDLDEIETALNSRDPGAIADVLTTEAAEAYGDLGQVLPAGATVDVLADTFAQSGEETAYVSAEVSGAQPGRQLLLLWLQDGSWRLVATAPEG